MTASTPEQKWLGIVQDAAMENAIMTPADIIVQATPDVLSVHLPPLVMSQILAASLKAKAMTPEVILETAGAQVLSRHLPAQVLWTAVRLAAHRAEANPEAHAARVAWLTTILEEGLQLGIMDSAHIIKHAHPDALARDLPPKLVSAMLQAGLDAGSFDPGLIVETVEPHNLAEHLPFPLLWACIEESAQAALQVDAPEGQAAPAIVAEPRPVIGEEFEAMEAAAPPPPQNADDFGLDEAFARLEDGETADLEMVAQGEQGEASLESEEIQEEFIEGAEILEEMESTPGPEGDSTEK